MRKYNGQRKNDYTEMDKIEQQEHPLKTWDERNFTTKEMASIFPLWTFHLYVARSQQHLYMEYISRSWYDIPELVVPIIFFPWLGVAANKEATKPRVLSGYKVLESS